MMRRRRSTLPAPPPRPTEVLATYKTLPEYRKWADLNIVGESFYQDNIARLLQDGGPFVDVSDGWGRLAFKAYAIAQPDNPHDPNAVAVYAGKAGYTRLINVDPKDCVQVGHLPKAMARRESKSFRERPVRSGWGLIIGKAELNLRKGVFTFDGPIGVKLDALSVMSRGSTNKGARHE